MSVVPELNGNTQGVIPSPDFSLIAQETLVTFTSCFATNGGLSRLVKYLSPKVDPLIFLLSGFSGDSDGN